MSAVLYIIDYVAVYGLKFKRIRNGSTFAGHCWHVSQLLHELILDPCSRSK